MGEGCAGVFKTTTASAFTETNISTVTFNRENSNSVNGSIICPVNESTQYVTEINFAKGSGRTDPPEPWFWFDPFYMGNDFPFNLTAFRMPPSDLSRPRPQ